MDWILAKNGVGYLKSNILHSKHAFSSRIGGLSRLEHTKGLNLAFGRGDDRDTVIANLEVFASAVGIDAKGIVSVSQIHSADVRYIGAENMGQGYYADEDFACDGYITETSGVTVGVKTADCVPILMEGYDIEGKVCAVGAFHAGWKGTVAGIAKVGFEKINGIVGNPDRIKIAIGPCICNKCFEVREDFVNAVRELLPCDAFEKFVKIDTEKDGVWHANLVGMNVYFLLGAGAKLENIDISEECTCCCPERYFSHRYSRGKRGTMLSIITME